MGRAKDEWMRQSEQGWSSVGDKWVCAKCFDDYAIVGFIEDNAGEKRCSYCDRSSRKEIAAHMDKVLEFIAAGIRSEYDDAGNGVGCDSSEGGYYGAPTWDSWDLLDEIGLNVENETLQDDLRRAFFQVEWSRCDPYGDRHCDALRYSWEAFSKLVKHRTRFVFFRVKTPGLDSYESEPYEFLDSLRSEVDETGLVREIAPQRGWFRAQEHPAGERLAGAKRLGAPPAERASHSRMSPAGIPMLYVAGDAATAIAEVNSGPPAGSIFTVGEFASIRPLRVLDLSNIPRVPSLFDENRRHMRMALIFLRQFAD